MRGALVRWYRRGYADGVEGASLRKPHDGQSHAERWAYDRGVGNGGYDFFAGEMLGPNITRAELVQMWHEDRAAGRV